MCIREGVELYVELSQLVCCVMIMKRLEWLACVAIRAQYMAFILDWWYGG